MLVAQEVMPHTGGTSPERVFAVPALDLALLFLLLQHPEMISLNASWICVIYKTRCQDE